jgi:hypothetical protein
MPALPHEIVIPVRVQVTVDQAAPAVKWDGEGVAGKLVKAAPERRYTLMVAYPANKLDIAIAKDGHQDFAGPDEVEDAAWNYMLKSRNIGLWHEDGTDNAGELVESYIYRGPDWVIKAADGTEHVIKAGDWLMGIRWTEPAWQDVLEGRINGVSMQGVAEREVADPADLIGLRS